MYRGRPQYEKNQRRTLQQRILQRTDNFRGRNRENVRNSRVDRNRSRLRDEQFQDIFKQMTEVAVSQD